MKKLTYLLMAVVAVAMLSTSCKKENTSTPGDITDDAAQLQLQSDDQSRFSNESDAVDDDVNIALESFGGTYTGRPLSPLPYQCDADVAVDTTGNPRTITITYSGDTCIGGHRSRTGSVVISFGPEFRWARPGAHISVTYNNLKITRLIDNKSITINGTKTITNVSGGKIINLSTSSTPIVHNVTSDGMNVTFDDGSQRAWKVARKRSFTYDNGVVISITGIAPAAVGDGVAEWGLNRFGREFKTAILQPLVIKQSCNLRLVSGQVQHTGFFVTTTVTFGLDANGDPVTNCPAGPFYYQAVWTARNGQTRTYTGPY